MRAAWCAAALLLGILAAAQAASEEEYMRGSVPCGAEDWIESPVFEEGEFRRCAKLDDRVVLRWKVVDEKGDPWVAGDSLEGASVIIAGQFRTADGWVGLGFSQGASMYGADMTIVRSQNQGKEWVVEDRFAESTVMPTLDEDQDVLLHEAAVVGGWTLIKIERKLKTCDPEDLDINEGPQSLLWAIGVDQRFGYHKARGASWVKFLHYDDPPPSMPADVETVDIVSESFEVPHDDMTKYCYSSALLPQDKKYHMLMAEPLIKSTHPETVHHMIIYRCKDIEWSSEMTFGKRHCSKEIMQDCDEFWVGWAVGGQELEMPPEAGLPMGVGGATRVVLEIHYNNVARTQGIVDQSGFRLHYSPTLRANDATTIVLGHVDLLLPAGAKSTKYANECPSVCTDTLPHDLHVIAPGLHMHQAGSKIWTQHVRGDKELPPLGTRHFWDFNEQNAPQISAVIKPGDRLITHCHYDTSKRTEDTTYGEGTKDEMCFNFLLVWPDPGLYMCSTAWENHEGNAAAACMMKDRTEFEEELTYGALFQPDRFLGNETLLELAKSVLKEYPAETPKYKAYTDPECPAGTPWSGSGPQAKAAEPGSGDTDSEDKSSGSNVAMAFGMIVLFVAVLAAAKFVMDKRRGYRRSLSSAGPAIV